MPTKAPASVRMARRVAWSDTDAGGHHHFTAVLRWVEEAEVILHERLEIADELSGRTPRVHVEVDFILPLWFRDVVDVEVQVDHVGRTSLRYSFAVFAGDRVAARGSYVVVLRSPHGMDAVEWSDDVRQRLLQAGPQPAEVCGPATG